MAKYHPLRVFSGDANRPLAEEVVDILGTTLGDLTITHLPDSEIHVQIHEPVRGEDVFLIQPCATPVNDNVMQLLLLIDAFRRASAASITAVVPYFPYGRQERMAKGREAISAKVFASALEMLGASRVMYFDVHAAAIQGFFNIPVDPLSAFPTFAEYFQSEGLAENAVIVSPDTGRAKLASRVSSIMDIPMVMMHKRRASFKSAKVTHVVGDIQDRRPIVIDDVIAGGSVIDSLPALLEAGARPEICVAITHPVLVGDSLKKLDAPYIQRVVVSNTIHLPPEKRHPKIEVVSIASVLAQVIQLVYEEKSITPVLSKLPGAR
jgi:ribose-phosphate pyrophosphokinase